MCLDHAPPAVLSSSRVGSTLRSPSSSFGNAAAPSAVAGAVTPLLRTRVAVQACANCSATFRVDKDGQAPFCSKDCSGMCHAMPVVNVVLSPTCGEVHTARKLSTRPQPFPSISHHVHVCCVLQLVPSMHGTTWKQQQQQQLLCPPLPSPCEAGRGRCVGMGCQKGTAGDAHLPPSRWPLGDEFCWLTRGFYGELLGLLVG